MVDASMDHGSCRSRQDTLPLKKPARLRRVRMPGGSAIRDGAYLAPGVRMPPR
jgi:hypothetical protein